MQDAIKIAIGAAATVLLGGLAHGPLGKGAAFMRGLQAEEQIVQPMESSFQPDEAPATRPVADAGCRSSVENALDGRVVSFRPGSAWLNPQSQRIIADVATALKQCPEMRIEVGGHSDRISRERAGRAMAEERAARVRNALLEQGVAANAVTAKGYGASAPPGEQNVNNRRATFTVVEGGE